MTLVIDIAWIVTVILVAVRLGAVLLLTPIFSLGSIPGHVRVLFVFALAAMLVGGLGVGARLPVESIASLLSAILIEGIIGALLAFGLFTAFATFMLAGRIVDMQLGFAVANLIDPTTRTQVPLLGSFLNVVAVVAFFAIDGHHMIIRGIAFSLEQIPPGTGLPVMDLGAVVVQFGAMFLYAVALVAPVIFTLLLIDVVIAVIARTMPQVNVFIVTLPLKIFVGLVMLALSLRYMSPVMARIFEVLFEYWNNLLG
jgi:flagellar biosynthetic protein FliR